MNSIQKKTQRTCMGSGILRQAISVMTTYTSGVVLNLTLSNCISIPKTQVERHSTSRQLVTQEKYESSNGDDDSHERIISAVLLTLESEIWPRTLHAIFHTYNDTPSADVISVEAISTIGATPRWTCNITSTITAAGKIVNKNVAAWIVRWYRRRGRRR